MCSVRWEQNFLNILLLLGFEGIKGHFDLCTSSQVTMHPFPLPMVPLNVSLY